jgi:hypothetical protein
MGSEGVAPFILNFSNRWRWMVNLAPQTLYVRRKRPFNPLNRQLGRLQSQSGVWRGETSFFVARNWTMAHKTSGPCSCHCTNRAIAHGGRSCNLMATTLWHILRNIWINIVYIVVTEISLITVVKVYVVNCCMRKWGLLVLTKCLLRSFGT